MVERQSVRGAAVLAGEPVAQEQIEAGEGGVFWGTYCLSETTLGSRISKEGERTIWS